MSNPGAELAAQRKGWGILWRSDSKAYGKTDRLVGKWWDHSDAHPRIAIFRTRQQARDCRDERYGYIRERDDLKREPHGWKLPKVVKVEIEYRVVGE